MHCLFGIRLRIGLLALSALLLSSCDTLLSVPPTQTATETATVISTITPTIVWFPATNTPTAFPTAIIQPTFEQRPGLGDLLLSDDFSDAAFWDVRISDPVSAAIGANALTLAVRQPYFTIISARQGGLISDFFLEITTSLNLCGATDEYGLLFRYNSPNDFYRLGLTCSSTIHLDRVRNSENLTLQAPVLSGDVPPGAPGEVRIGVWASGSEMRIFLNGRYQFTAFDPAFQVGGLAVYARSNGDSQVSVNFSNLVVSSVAYVSPTPTLTPSRTPVPTSTMKPSTTPKP
jgi:hypothetical protein